MLESPFAPPLISIRSLIVNEKSTELNILLHAPTPSALVRARNNAANLAKDAPHAIVRIVVNAEAVAAALDMPNAAADPVTLVCPNTLAKLGRSVRPPLTVLNEGAVLALAKMQLEGSIYMRA